MITVRDLVIFCYVKQLITEEDYQRIRNELNELEHKAKENEYDIPKLRKD